MNVPHHEAKTANEIETQAFCLRRMETVIDSDCRLCFDGHEQLQAGYRSRIRCAELHWVEIAAFLPLPSALGSRIFNGSNPLPCPDISHPPKERHPRWT